MAVSAAYARYTRIPTSANLYGPGPEVETALVLNNSSADSAVFRLLGGWYAFDVKATGFGTVTLEKLMPDGTTYAICATAIAADGSVTLQLSAGSYKLVLA